MTLPLVAFKEYLLIYLAALSLGRGTQTWELWQCMGFAAPQHVGFQFPDQEPNWCRPHYKANF